MVLLDLLHVQRAGFFKLLKLGISKELTHLNINFGNTCLRILPFSDFDCGSAFSKSVPIHSKVRAFASQSPWASKAIVSKTINTNSLGQYNSMNVNCFRLIAPKFTPLDAILYQKSWSCKIVVKVLLTIHEKNLDKNLQPALGAYPNLALGSILKKRRKTGYSRTSTYLCDKNTNLLELWRQSPPSNLPCSLNDQVEKTGSQSFYEHDYEPQHVNRVKKAKRKSFVIFKDGQQNQRLAQGATQEDFEAKDQGIKNKAIFQKRNYELFLVLGELPLMTKQGNFIINGSPRVVLSQLVRTPGIYFTEKNNELQADCIPEQGPWLCISKKWNPLTNTFSYFCYTKQFSSIPFSFVFSSFRIFELYSHFTDRPLLLIKLKTLEKIHRFERGIGALLKITWKMRKRKRLRKARKRFRQLLTDQYEKTAILFRLQKKFVLDEKSRTNFREKLGISNYINTGCPCSFGTTGTSTKLKNSASLLSQDLALIVRILTSRKIKSLDDIDDLNNQQVRTPSSQIQEQIQVGILRLQRRLKKIVIAGGGNRSLTDFLNGALREFFGSNQMSQFLDQTNPLAEITHKRRISKLGVGGIQRESATLKVRTIHSTYFGRICPIETPEGLNAGLVNSLTCLSRVNQKGQLVTPLSLLVEGQKQDHFFYYSNKEDHALSTTDTTLLKFQRLPNQFIYTKNKSQFQQVEPNKVKLRVISDLQTISLATALIPFLAYDDANRALMGSNMQRQAVPLMLPERPIIRTGMESLVLNESGHSFQSFSSGFISYISAQYVILFCNPLNKRSLIK